MRLKSVVFKHGEIVLTVWFKKELSVKQDARFMIFCYGLPSHPYQHNPAKVEAFCDKGFILVYPNYAGTWASDGVMNWESCVESIHKTIAFLKKGNGLSAYDNKEFSWNVKDITLVGGSFGGSVALVAGAKSRIIKNIIAVAAPTNWRNHSRIPEETAEPIEGLFYAVQRGWRNLWRIPSKKEWMRLATGSADLNAVDYVRELKYKNVMLIHGKNDPVVSVKRSIDIYDAIKKASGKKRLIILKNEGHLGNDAIGNSSVMKQVLEFLS
ncbi:MAG: prolyl oligopeptidase family serine peptidase [archaeon]